MNISDDIKQKIEVEYKAWEAGQYAGKTKEERQKMAQFFTPPVLSIKMLEKFDSVIDKDILDPTLGAGGLIAAAVMSGADPRRCYGIELDEKILEVAKKRLAKLGVPPYHLAQGDALDSNVYESIEDDHKSLEDYVIIDKLDNGSIHLFICKHGCEVKDVVIEDRQKMRDVLSALKSKEFKLFKI